MRNKNFIMVLDWNGSSEYVVYKFLNYVGTFTNRHINDGLATCSEQFLCWVHCLTVSYYINMEVADEDFQKSKQLVFYTAVKVALDDTQTTI